MAYSQPYFLETAIIANGETTSGAVDLEFYAAFKLIMPAAFTGTAITFSVSYDGTTWATLHNGTADVSKTVAAAKCITLDPKDFQGIRYIKLISNSAEGAARSIGIVARPL